jgi:hypothetical protein
MYNNDEDYLSDVFTHNSKKCYEAAYMFFRHRLTTTFIQIGKIRQSFAVEYFSDKINDDIYQTR